MTPPPVPLTELAKRLGLSATTLHVWNARYGWPKPLPPTPRKHGRVYSAETAERIMEFVKRGRPFHEIENGEWPAQQDSGRQKRDPDWVEDYRGMVDDVFLRALVQRRRPDVEQYLAMAARMRPMQRALIVECLHSANNNGWLDSTIRTYGRSLV